MKKLTLALIATFSLGTALAQTSVTNVKSGNSQKQTHRPTVEIRAERSAEHLKSELGLTNEQFTKVYDLKLAKYKEIDNVKATMSGEDKKADRKAAFQTIREAYKTEMKNILTDEQEVKWEAQIKVKQDRMKKGWEQQPNSKPAETEGQLMQIELD